MIIGRTELALQARIRALFGDRLRQVDSWPAEWTPELIKQYAFQAPAVFVTFSGGMPGKGSAQGAPQLDARFALAVLTTHPNGERARRMGDTRMIGAYEIIERLIGGLHGCTLSDGDDTLCSLHFDGCQNLLELGADVDGAITIYGVIFSTGLTFDSNLGPDDLVNFLRYRQDVKLQPADTANDTDAQDAVDLEPAP